MNSPLLEFALLSFVSLFTMVNPLGAIPIFSSMTAALPLQFVEDIAITPLGIPMICGPGAITSAIILMNQSQTLLEKGVLLAVILLVLSLTYFILVSGKSILALVGDSGNKVLLRLMDLIVMMIAVEFFFAGLKPIVKDMIFIHR